MTTKLNVLQVIPKLGYGGAETGCYDIAHFLSENDCGSFLATSGGELLRFVKKDKVKLLRLPVHSKNPFLMLFNTLMLVLYIILFNFDKEDKYRSRQKQSTSMVLLLCMSYYSDKFCNNFSWNL